MVAERRLKVLQMLPALEGGGVERGVVELNRFLSAEGHDSVVISEGGRMVETIEAEGGRHLAWQVGRKSLWTLRLVWRLRRFLREERVDVLHLRSRVPAWLGYLAWRGMPVGDRPRLVTTVHGFYSVNGWSSVMTKGERVIAVSESIREYAKANYPRLEHGRIEVIHRGIDPALYHPEFQPSKDWQRSWLADFPTCRGKKILVLPGRVTRLKGHADFLRILAELKARDLPVHGFIVGGVAKGKEVYGREVTALRDQLALSGEVTMTGPRDDLREILAFAELSFSLSMQPESFGRTVCEALSLGRPVIGYDHGGVGEQLRVLFPKGRITPGDWRGAADLMEELLKDPPSVKPNDTFFLDNTLRRTLALYDGLMEKRR